ncbi:MAG: hypothetical protein V1660_00950 [archaeon]
MEKFLISLDSAEKKIKIADHMTYITFPLLKDRRLLIKILDEVNKSFLEIINAIIYYEQFYKRIAIHNDPVLNFRLFRERCAQRFGISTSEIEKIMELFVIIDKHNQSAMEFVRNDKFVIMSNNSHTDILTVEKLKEFLNLSKEMFKKTSFLIQKRG